MSHLFTITVLLLVLNYGSSLTYPVFGTKRYHRANVVSPIMAAPIPLYTALPQYYDGEQPYPVVFPNEELYSNSYYYPAVTHRETHPPRNNNNYRTYGMPTYRGEYKPQPYYYAHAPTYNYYDDHIDSGNPLDDLHEEILQEDERERQRDMLPIGQETWFENNDRQDQSLVNANAAFLRNLIAYNKQMEAAKEQQYQAEQFQNQDSLVGNDEEFDDYLNDEEIYDMQPPNNNNNNINNNNNYFYDSEKIVPQTPEFPTTNTLKVTKNEDKDVKDLKSLITNHKNIPPIHQQLASLQNIQPQKNSNSHNQFAQITKNSNINSNLNNINNNNQQTSSLQQQYDDPEYDDSWINWDRKRSSIVSSQKRDQSIYNFSDRKITNGEHKIALAAATTTTTTALPPSPDHLEQSLKKLSGQKEVVLPRPATPVRRVITSTSSEMGNNDASFDISENKRGNKESMYDTIKQLLALEHHHEKNKQLPEPTRLQKRYIANEETLVQELNGLKRISV